MLSFEFLPSTEICQRACKYAIREDIEEDIKRKIEGLEDSMEEVITEIKRFRSDFKFPEAATSADGLNPAVTSSGGDEDDELY
ncbi:hypothetical protein Peur_068878 [Populus x canadensis]